LDPLDPGEGVKSFLHGEQPRGTNSPTEAARAELLITIMGQKWSKPIIALLHHITITIFGNKHPQTITNQLF
jgi:hypothetical protein